jgi:hypothetical protein
MDQESETNKKERKRNSEKSHLNVENSWRLLWFGFAGVM